MTIRASRSGGEQQMFSTPMGGPTLGEYNARHDAPNEGTQRMREAALSPLTTRAPIDVVPSILQHGFLTQHHTGTSQGSLDPQARREQEGMMFPDDVNAEPVYGYMSTPESEASVHAYGGARFTMKPHVREDTTITNRDSLGWDPSVLDITELSGAGSMVGAAKKPAWGEYVEAQMHGQPQARDVANLDISLDAFTQLKREAERSKAGDPSWADFDANSRDFERNNIGIATNAAALHDVPTTFTRTEKYEQENLDLGESFPQEQYPFMASSGQRNVPQRNADVVKEMGHRFSEVGSRVQFDPTHLVENYESRLKPEYPSGPPEEDDEDW